MYEQLWGGQKAKAVKERPVLRAIEGTIPRRTAKITWDRLLPGQMSFSEPMPVISRLGTSPMGRQGRSSSPGRYPSSSCGPGGPSTGHTLRASSKPDSQSALFKGLNVPLWPMSLPLCNVNWGGNLGNRWFQRQCPGARRLYSNGKGL